MKNRICRKCHKPSGNRPMCKTCERVVEMHKDAEARQEARLWVKQMLRR